MPIIQVNLLEGRTVAQKRAMIAAVTDAVVESLGVKRETVRILINELQAENFALGGVSAGEQPLNKRSGHPSASNGSGVHAPEPRHNGVTVE
uniref:Tautomerase n=1 Tax=uncultured bacterium 16 TaxID=1748268 RepID=A0A0U3U9R1_9BACT|nr:hypothetical protein [uncultured bacterium 16]